MKYFLAFVFLFSSCVFGQNKPINTRNTQHLSSLSTHPFGVFFSRIHHNFQTKAGKQISFESHLASGNIWLQNVDAYFLKNKAEQEAISNIVWHERWFSFDATTQEHSKMNFEADGVLRQYINTLNIPFLRQHELQITTRMFSLDEGNFPFSVLTNDNIIEAFHTNIAGGEDPFGRRNYPFNKARIRYSDSEGNQLVLNNKDFVFSGIDLSYNYYPKFNFFERINLFTSIGFQTGINFSNVNKSIDLGIHGAATKIFALGKNHELRTAWTFGLMHPNLMRFSDKSLEMVKNKFLFSTEMNLEYVKHLKKSNYISLAFGYGLQSPLRPKKEFDSIIIEGDRRSTHWHYTFSHLYRYTSANTLSFTYGSNFFAFWVYLRQDFLVDNAPDVQTGLGLKIYIQPN